MWRHTLSVLKAKRKRLDNLILPFIEKMYFHLIGYAEKNLTATEAGFQTDEFQLSLLLANLLFSTFFWRLPSRNHHFENLSELKLILEEPMQTGETLFSAASYNSLPIASDLIARNIEINFINDLFMTPQARANQNSF